MPKYRATIHVSGLTGDNPRAVRAALDAELGKSGLHGCRIVAIDIDAPSPRLFPHTRRAAAPPRRPPEVGGVFLVAAAAAAIWFVWWMVTAVLE